MALRRMSGWIRVAEGLITGGTGGSSVGSKLLTGRISFLWEVTRSFV